MKKIILATVAASQIFIQAQAGGDIEPIATQEQVEETVTEESKFYVVVKGLTVLGDTVQHGESLLDGDRGYGFGIDVGYRLGHGFALEYDFSYARNTVLEKREGFATEEARARYYTSALDLVYTAEITEELGLFAKVGYEYEWEKINDFNIDGRDNGLVYGAGVEIAMNEKYKFVAEYEHSTIDGPHGDSIFAGIMYNF